MSSVNCNQEKKYRPLLHFSVVSIVKGTFGSPLITSAINAYDKYIESPVRFYRMKEIKKSYLVR